MCDYEEPTGCRVEIYKDFDSVADAAAWLGAVPAELQVAHICVRDLRVIRCLACDHAMPEPTIETFVRA